MFRSYSNTRQMATVVVRKHLSTRAHDTASRTMWSEMGNHNNWVRSNANSPEMNAKFQAILNANRKEMNASRKEMNANFQAMLNANNKEMNANFQAMLNANRKEMNADRKEMNAIFQSILTANAKTSGSSSSTYIGVVAVAISVVFAIAGLQERNFDRTTAEITPIKDKITQILIDSATNKEQNRNILDAINILQQSRK